MGSLREQPRDKVLSTLQTCSLYCQDASPWLVPTLGTGNHICLYACAPRSRFSVIQPGYFSMSFCVRPSTGLLHGSAPFFLTPRGAPFQRDFTLGDANFKLINGKTYALVLLTLDVLPVSCAYGILWPLLHKHGLFSSTKSFKEHWIPTTVDSDDRQISGDANLWLAKVLLLLKVTLLAQLLSLMLPCLCVRAKA